jgi:hypothetical protein
MRRNVKMAFTLESVLELGGQRKDFEALQTVDEEENSDIEVEVDGDAGRTSHVDDSEVVIEYELLRRFFNYAICRLKGS